MTILIHITAYRVSRLKILGIIIVILLFATRKAMGEKTGDEYIDERE